MAFGSHTNRFLGHPRLSESSKQGTSFFGVSLYFECFEFKKLLVRQTVCFETEENAFYKTPVYVWTRPPTDEFLLLFVKVNNCHIQENETTGINPGLGLNSD